MKTIVELAIAHYPSAKAILEEEKKLHPEWSESIVYADFPEWYRDRLAAEPQIADIVFGASPFTLKTLLSAGIPEEKLVLLPLGCDTKQIPFDRDAFPSYNGRPLRLLYAGRISQMKGIKYLLEAMKEFGRPDVELHLIGFAQGCGEALKPYKTFFTHHPHVSQKELYAQYKHYDALVLPSVYEGFGLVIVEAMAAGLPVITTDHTMGPDIIEHGKNGYMVPIRNVEAIRAAAEKLLGKSNDELMEMRIAAHRAAMNYSWDRYQERLKGVIDQLLTN
jgi:glycosyltransferase involved in cell wall biosynthesis